MDWIIYIYIYILGIFELLVFHFLYGDCNEKCSLLPISLPEKMGFCSVFGFPMCVLIVSL